MFCPIIYDSHERFVTFRRWLTLNIAVPTVVITSLMCDLMSDPKLLARPVFTGNRKRNNRVAGFVLTLVGSIIGGWMLKATGQVQPVLWFVFAIKFVISIGWIGWKGQDPKEDAV